MSIDINFSLADPELGSSNINRLNNSIELLYPCSNQINCTCYKGVFDPGTYFVELYGASGGRTATPYRFENNTFIDQSVVNYYKGNAVPLDDNSSRGGAGGYTSGCLIIPRRTTMFIHLGGEGTFGKKSDKGGYNGGGSSSTSWPHGAGGGATDIRAEEDDLFHRIMVSGGGGGSDDTNTAGTFGTGNDGSGGAGGGLIAQGYFVNGKLVSNYLAKQKTGYSFGNGENGQMGESKHPDGKKDNPTGSADRPGAGGGWFGGFASFNGDAGSGGGSSFALTYDAQYPTGVIHVYDGYYNDTGIQGRYAFQRHQYLVTNPTFVPGIWVGNGMVRITPLSLEHKIIVSAFTCKYRNRNNHQVLVYIILISSKQ